MLAITVSAQTKTLLDKILEPLNETCNYKMIYHLDKPNRICTNQYYSITSSYTEVHHITTAFQENRFC